MWCRVDVKLCAWLPAEAVSARNSKKVFAKLAFEVFALNLIRAFVGVCGHVVSVLCVCGVRVMTHVSHACFGVLLLTASC